MRKQSKILLVICPLLFIGAGCDESSIACESESSSTSISFVSISEDDDFSQCKLGEYDEDHQWILNSADEYEKLGKLLQTAIH